MFLSAKAYFDQKIDYNITLLRRAETALPAEFVKRYKKNVVKITPKKSGRLRRSIITQSLGNRASISWRAPYASAQEAGHHSVYERRVVNIGGRFVTLKGNTSYRYRNYTTAGTGANFATKAFIATKAELSAIYRELGLTK